MTRPGRRSGLAPSLSWAALCVTLAGVLTAGYLALVARSLPAVEYGWFGAFWSVALIIGFGAFFPIEQELARLVHLAGPGAPLPRGTVRAVGGVTALSLGAVLGSWPLLRQSLGGSGWLLLALAALCAASGAQFVVRGLLLGRGALASHGSVLLADAALRVGAAAAVVAVAGPATATPFGWTVVLGAVLAHAPLLAWLLRRRPRPTAPAGPRMTVGAVGPLIVGALCAQVLLNAAPVLVVGVAAADEQVLAAQFVAGFTLIRLPLFLAVPLQGALIPHLVGVTADRRGSLALVGRTAGGVGVLCALAALAGWLVGPLLVRLLFGDRYVLGGGALAVLAVGTALYLGLLATSQALVAAARHRDVGLVWSTGLAAAAVVFLAVPGLIARTGLAYVVGCGVAFVVSLVLLVRHGRARPRTSPVPELTGGAG
ncbi:hypothetical protein GCU56_08885 [Geodermatophilus sabuli]|uniref:Membrane protein involved in the export of O-antigen and teichoic acid n=1 Tax=Geodermatophilus sabuli TaxID=1564158 RepID=A0A7K3VZA3_9ACTN|nr:hypothetical protein [Geodermatophilus sabuli]NEK57985.1 hypothetical protein [Geodermatophilus sabuli]